MNPYKTKKIARVIAIIIIAAMVITSVTMLVSVAYAYGADKQTAAQEDAWLNSQLDLLKEYLSVIQETYKDEVDYETLMKGAFAGAIDILGDPYSVYYTQEGEAESFFSAATGSFFGVGIAMEFADGAVRVVSVLPDTPAAKAGVRDGDVIREVDGVSMDGKNTLDVAAAMQGKEGTAVKVTVERAGEEISFTLIRALISLQSVEGALLEDGIGYIRIANFDEDSDEEFKQVRKNLLDEGAKSFILDVRDNPGGLVDTATNIAEMLMPAGPIVHFMHKERIIETFAASGAGYVAAPTVLLTNGGSASASEILAGALQDSGSATLVGTTTYGKGVGQYLIDFPDGSTAKLSAFYFITPDKHTVNEVGIQPDYVVPGLTVEDSVELLVQYKDFAPMSEEAKPAIGDVGLNVFGAQQRLSFLGYTAAVSGSMDQATSDAVKKFQKENGLYAYGVLDYGTMAKLDEACLQYAIEAMDGADLQLEKAVELLTAK
ncbi:MAG: S41 family peptidase [Clostridiales Family XIII bacterium]|nr:S41 family peptidase [Clostridiales Family XIII bacterium]